MRVDGDDDSHDGAFVSSASEASIAACRRLVSLRKSAMSCLTPWLSMRIVDWSAAPVFRECVLSVNSNLGLFDRRASPVAQFNQF